MDIIFSAIVIGSVVLIAYIWGSRGFFSAFLHMVCVIVAGAIAFAAWEPLAHLILNSTGKVWISDAAWGVALAIPFALSLAIIRVSMDKLVPANIEIDALPNLLGGLACGAVSGTIATGIMTLAMFNLRVGDGFAYYSPIDFDQNGNVVRTGKLFYPADFITTAFYSYASESSLRPARPLAHWRPAVRDQGVLLNSAPAGFNFRLTLAPKHFDVQGRYTVGHKNPLTVNALLNYNAADERGRALPRQRDQKAATFDGEDVPGSSRDYYLEGYAVQIKPQASEAGGWIMTSNPQIQLVAYSQLADSSITLHPVAIISPRQTEAADAATQYGRWRCDSKGGTWIRSTGGGLPPPFIFEFLVPRAYTPLALYVKGVRADIRSADAEELIPVSRDYESPTRRDAAMHDKSLVIFKKSDLKPVQGTITLSLAGGFDLSQPVRVTNTLPANRILLRENKKALQLNEDGHIQSGDQLFRNQELLSNRGTDIKLQTRQLAVTDDTVMVQVDVSLNSQLSLARNPAAVQASGAAVLIDDHGNAYYPRGYIYFDAGITRIRYLPGEPMTELRFEEGIPTEARTDQHFLLIYLVSADRKLTAFGIGDTMVARIDPPLEIKKR